MSLGENIIRYRNARELSQEKLAEELGVSRQAVSKWETDASTPELDKLLAMSELFGVTLDELVRDGAEPRGGAEETRKAEEAPAQRAEARSGVTLRQGAGLLLLALGAVLLLALLLLSASLLESAALSAPLLLCGLILLTARRHPGLWCGWMLWLWLLLIGGAMTGFRFSPHEIFRARGVSLATNWGMALFSAALLVFTWRARKKR